MRGGGLFGPLKSICWSADVLVRSVMLDGPSPVCHNILKGQKVTLPCSYRSTGCLKRGRAGVGWQLGVNEL